MSRRHSSSESILSNNAVKLKDRYELTKCIGQGSYGEVWLVQPKSSLLLRTNKKQYVLKRLNLKPSGNNLSQNEIETAEREAQLMSTLKHPNIVVYTESFRSIDGFLNIVMVYCEGGDLYTKIKEKRAKHECLTEDKIMEWFIQICMALQYLHAKNILHRDLKTQNIFLTRNEIVKVGDLGIARELKSSKDLATTIVGTPYYMSPEIFSRKPYGSKSDIWSMGCCVYEMTSLEHAFNAADLDSLIQNILSGKTPQITKTYSPELKLLITSMLMKTPDFRPTATDILQDTYVKKHILRFLEQTQKKCQKPATTVVEPILNKPSGSSPPRPAAALNDSPIRNRLPNNNLNGPLLPSCPLLPPSYPRPSSSPNDNQILSQSNDSPKSNQRIARRRPPEMRRSNPLSSVSHESIAFLSNVSQNDTLQRRKSDTKINSPRKKQPSSSDEQDISPTRPGNLNNMTPRETTATSESSEINVRKTARERRREKKTNLTSSSSSVENSTPGQSPNQTVNTNTAQIVQATPQDNLDDEEEEEVERKIEREKEFNDLTNMLTSTLNLSQINISPKISSNDRTISSCMHETNRLYQRCQSIQNDCLREISPEKLARVLNILRNVAGTKLENKIIEELGEDLYEKYSAQLFSLRFYQDSLSIRI